MSFYLRKFSGQDVQMNIALGRSYTLVHRHINYEDFRASFNVMFGKPHVADNDPESDEDTQRVYAILSDENGKLIPLYKGQASYIVTERGATYDNVSY